MQPSGCPGQDKRFLTAEEVKCPGCGYQVELFSDERSRKCPRCERVVSRDMSLGCAEWCSAAKTCALLRGAKDGDPTG